MKHTPKTAAKAVRLLFLNSYRIAVTWGDYGQQQAHLASLPPRERASDQTWANAFQAYRLTAEQVHGPQAKLTQRQDLAIQKAVQEVMPELFAEYWERKLHGESTK
jgi:hypothetical protein